MSAVKLPRRACTAFLCAALVATFSGIAAAQSSNNAIDGNGVAAADQASAALGAAASSADELPAPLHRQLVVYSGNEPPGTIIVDTAHTFLYLTLDDGKALRYGIGVGRAGFTWSGVEKISRKSEWPDWIPPADMIARQPYLPRWVGGGPGNPLGARALYLGNTDYRIHGTNNPGTIGKRVSSGCIRMRDADVIDLYNRVGIGTKVVVLPGDREAVPISDQKAVSIEGARGGMSATITVRPVAFSSDRVLPRAEWRSNPTTFGLY